MKINRDFSREIAMVAFASFQVERFEEFKKSEKYTSSQYIAEMEDDMIKALGLNAAEKEDFEKKLNAINEKIFL